MCRGRCSGRVNTSAPLPSRPVEVFRAMRFLTTTCFAFLALIAAPSMSTVGLAHGILEAGATSAPPFGTVDTPVEHAVGVTGAVPFTGWALDDVGIARVGVCRSAVP